MKSPEILEPHQVIPLQQVLGEGLHRPRFQALPGRKTVNLFDIYIYLVGGILTPLKNMSASVGMMTFPIYGKIKNVRNHRPDIVFDNFL